MIPIEWMPPLMFGGLVLFMLIGYPVAFSLSALGLLCAFISIQAGWFQPEFMTALPINVFGILSNDLLLAYLSWPFFMQAYSVGEMSGNAGGLVRWPIKFVIPSGFVMLALQGVSEVIKRIAALKGEVTIDAKYERPTQ